MRSMRRHPLTLDGRWDSGLEAPRLAQGKRRPPSASYRGLRTVLGPLASPHPMATSEDAPSGRRFQTTRWSLVLRAGGHDAPAARLALESLCKQVWFPLYGYVRRRGYGPEDAQDLVQGFFARLLESGNLATVPPPAADCVVPARRQAPRANPDGAQRSSAAAASLVTIDSRTPGALLGEPRTWTRPTRLERRWAKACSSECSAHRATSSACRAAQLS